MTQLISKIQSTKDANNEDDEDEQISEDEELETTSKSDIKDFNKWAKNEAYKDLSSFKKFTNLTSIENLRQNVSSLNTQQRKLFDDLVERLVSTDIDDNPCYLFIAGEAGTGKSHLVRVLIEAVKIIEIKSGSELPKPPVIIVAPTANAAFLIGGKTIDSAFGFSPADAN